jgi:telomere length regulation protein
MLLLCLYLCDAILTRGLSLSSLLYSCIIEYLFIQSLSTMQRYAMLSALALGARELAGMPGPSGGFAPNQVEAFPSKRLAARLESKLLEGDPVEAITKALTRVALTSAREGAEATIPEASREKALRVGGRLGSLARADIRKSAKDPASPAIFGSLAADCFIMPLINRFWLYLRDLSTASVASRSFGAGSAALLDPIFLCKFMSTLAILIDASRHSSHFLAVLAPEALQLATLGLRGFDNDDEGVRAALLEFSLVTINTCISVDAGRTLARDFTPLLATLQEWAQDAWRTEEARGKVERAGRAAAGLLLRADEVLSRSVTRSLWPV